MLEVQKYLLDHTLEQLSEELGIKVKKYPEDNIVLLDYDQIESPKTHPIVIECRSLILSLDDYSVVSRKFNRFFNYGEALDLYKDFCFEGATAYEKADGSLIGIYFNRFTETWEISTRGMAKAEGNHQAGGNFREMVLSAFGFTDEIHFQKFAWGALDSDVTYIFEYTSPLNRIVTPYTEDTMVLLSVVENTEEFTEHLHHDLAVFLEEGLNVRKPEQHTLSSLSDAKALTEALTGLKEGFVLYCHKTGLRMKMKNITYLVAHRTKGNDPTPSRKNLLTAILGGDIDEFISYFPEFAKHSDPIKAEVELFLESVTEVWEDAKHIQDQKEFALKVKDYPFSGVLFQAKKSGESAASIWRNIDVARKLKMFKE